jgi:dienelactone hydrolase
MRAAVLAVVVFSLGATIAFGESTSSRPRISVDRSDALWDAPLGIVVSQIAPHQRAELGASTVDDLGRPWVSTTRVRADGGGRVDLAGDAALRVLWSVHPPSAGPADYYVYVPPAGGAFIHLTLSVGGRAVSAATVRRRLRTPDERVRTLRPAREGFYGEMFEPKQTRTARPAALLFGGSEGGLGTVIRNLASLLAARGYPTLALAYFGEPGLPENLLRIRLEYFARALRWLAAQPSVDSARLAVAGISRGSEAAQLLGVHYPTLVHAVVALVPSNAVVCGIPRFTGTSRVGCIGPAWTLHGKAIPYLRGSNPFITNGIPDEHIHGPVFLACGGQDSLWPSCPMAHAIAARLRAHRFAYQVRLLDYEQAGHGVGALR